MVGPAWSVDTVVALLLASVAYCTMRVITVLTSRRGERLDVHVSHVVMATVMSLLLLNDVNLGPRAMWVGVFVGFAGWFIWRSVIALRDAPLTWRVIHESNHAVASGSMLAMFAGGAMVRGGSMSQMSATSSQPGWYLPVALMLGAALAWYLVWNARMLFGVGSVALSTPQLNPNSGGVVVRRLIGEIRVARCCDVVMAGSMIYMFALVH